MSNPSKKFRFPRLILSWLYLWGAKIHYHLLKLESQKQKTPSLPLWVVGGLKIGGSGKTSLVIALGQYLNQQGISYAVLCHPVSWIPFPGFREKKVLGSSNWKHFSDEACLLKKSLGADIFLTNNRFKTWEKLEKSGHYQILISDDGGQDPRLKNTTRILTHPLKEVQKWPKAKLKPFSRKWFLPFPLGVHRIIEPWQIEKNEWLLETNSIRDLKVNFNKKDVSRKAPTKNPKKSRNPRESRFPPKSFFQINNSHLHYFRREITGFTELTKSPFLLLTAIANPQKLVSGLAEKKCIPTKIILLKDHSSGLAQKLKQIRKSQPNLLIATTEKDYVKLDQENDPNIVILKQVVNWSDSFGNWIDNNLKSISTAGN